MPVTGDGRADADTAYFDSKEAVFAEVAQQVVETMMEGLHTELRPGYRPGGADPAGRQSFVDRSARGIRRMQADGIADPRTRPGDHGRDPRRHGGPDLLHLVLPGQGVRPGRRGGVPDHRLGRAISIRDA